MLSNPDFGSGNPRFQHSPHRKTDLFGAQEDTSEAPVARKDRNRSSVFAPDTPKRASAKQDRMASNIFFNETSRDVYVPSQAPQQREQHLRDTKPEPSAYLYDGDYGTNRRAALQKAFRSNVFEEEALPESRGRRHFAATHQDQDVFSHHEAPVRHIAKPVVEQQPVHQRSSSRSTSFSNLFGDAASQAQSFHEPSYPADTHSRVGGLPSDHLNRGNRGKGGVRPSQWGSQLW